MLALIVINAMIIIHLLAPGFSFVQVLLCGSFPPCRLHAKREQIKLMQELLPDIQACGPLASTITTQVEGPCHFTSTRNGANTERMCLMSVSWVKLVQGYLAYNKPPPRRTLR